MKSPVKFGLIASILIIALYLGIYYSGNMFTQVGQLSWLISLAIMLPFIALAIKAKRTELGGFIDYRESIKAGLGTTLIIAVIFAAFNYFFFRFELAGATMLEVEQHIIKTKVDKEKAYAMMRDAYLFTQPGAQAASTIMRTLIAGAVISFAAATFIVRKRNEA